MTSAIGLGCMSFAGFYGATDEAESRACLDAALDAGVTHWDTAERYGDGRSEEIIGRYLRDKPAEITLATKGGIYAGAERSFSNNPDKLRESLESSLKRLGVEKVDLYYIHRRAPEIPIEDVVGTLLTFREEGKIDGFGFSEIAPSELRRAHAVAPVCALQSEYSLWSRQPDLGMKQTCAELGVAFVAFSPLARGMLGETDPDPVNFSDQDFRRHQPRFIEPNFSFNCSQLASFREFARSRGWTTAGAAIAWCLDQGDHIIPIPGTRTAAHLAEWAAADQITFTDEDRAEIEQILPVGWAHGDRYADNQYGSVARYS